MSHPFSHSSLSTFEKCPAKYRFHYVDEIEKPHESIEAFVGRRVHETLEYLYREVSKERVPVYDRIADYFQEKWDDEWHGNIVIVNRRSPVSEYLLIGEQCLAWYYRRNFPFKQPVVGTEVEMVFKLNERDSFEIKGIVDRLDNMGGGRWEIHDYKTSSRPMAQAGADRDRQLALYQIGIEKTYGDVREVDLVWHFLRSGRTVRSRRSPDQLARLKSAIRKLVKEIERRKKNGGPFPPRESPLCNWCYYWLECPAKIGNNPFVKPRNWE